MAGLRPYEQSSATGKRFPGQLLLRPSSKLKQYTLSYSKGRTLFRPWGDLLVPENGGPCHMAPWRTNEGFGISWFVQDDICMAWGIDFKFTALTRCVDEEKWPLGSPLQLLYDEVKYNDAYKALTVRKGDSFPQIGSPRHCGFIKGLLIEHNKKSYAQNPIWGVMLVLPPSANDSLADLLNEEAAASDQAVSEADPHGFDTRYKVGNPISLKTGKVFEFDKESNLNNSDTGTIDVQADGRANAKSAGDSPIERYGCRLYPNKTVLPLPEDKVKKYDDSFEKSMWFMTGDEQIENLIIRGFGKSCRDLVITLFGGKGLLPSAYEFGQVVVDMTVKQAPKVNLGGGPIVKEETLEVNLEGDSEDVPEEQPEETSARTAEGPVFTPEPPKEAPAKEAATMSTADSIRQRLAQLSAKKPA